MKKISFLDTLLELNPDHSLSATLYHKPIDTYNYVLYKLSHKTMYQKFDRFIGKATFTDNPHPKHFPNVLTQRNVHIVGNKSGHITSTTTGRSYLTQSKFMCLSNNFIYCIQCNKCGLQYVGQAYRCIMLPRPLPYIQ